MRRQLRSRFASFRSSLELLLGRRLVLFAVVDGLVILAALLSMLLGDGDEPAAVWSGVVLPPFLLLGLPALSGIVEVERRAGCLDLALTTPAAEAYFLRRAAAVASVLCAQGWLLLGLDWLFEGGTGFPLLPALVKVAIVSLFLAAVALFWAVRTKSGGAVWLASMGTVLAFSRWFFSNPIPDRHFAVWNGWVAGGEESLAFLGDSIVLLGAASIFFLYARRRLRRPETLVS